MADQNLRCDERLVATAITTAVVFILALVVRSEIIDYRGFAGAGDFGGAIQLARNITAGRDPYDGFTDVPYPLPAGLVAMPFARLDDRLAGSLFLAASSGLLAGAVVAATHQPWRLLLLFSLPYAHALEWAQWSPLITAAWYLPVVAPLMLVAKPQIALPIALHRVSKGGITLAGLVLLLSFLICPDWPVRWLRLAGGYQYIIPILTPGGFLLASSALKWRDEKARLLLAMSLLPARGPYDLLPLFVFPNSGWQMGLMVIASWVVPFRTLHVLYLVALAFVWLRSRR